MTFQIERLLQLLHSIPTLGLRNDDTEWLRNNGYDWLRNGVNKKITTLALWKEVVFSTYVNAQKEVLALVETISAYNYETDNFDSYVPDVPIALTIELLEDSSKTVEVLRIEYITSYGISYSGIK